MSTISLKNVSFAYDGQDKIFDNLNLNLDSNWKLGLIGRNGRGKTTFMKMLLKQVEYQGTIQSDLEFNYYPQVINDPDNLTIYALQEQFNFEEWELKRELNLLHAKENIIWQPFSTLSGGEQTKILLALCFINQHSFALLDEPTNHLDEDTRNQVAQYLHNKKQGLIVISHDRNFVDKVVDHTLAIEMQKIRLEQGNYTRYEKQKELEDESNIAYNAKLEKQIKNLHASQQKMQTFAQRSESNKNAGAKMKGDIRHRSTVYDKGFMGHKAAKKMKLAKNVEARLDKNIEERKGLLKNIEADNDLAMNFVPDHRKHLITAKGISLAYDKLPLFQPTTFDLMRGHQIVITGKNGIGKSSLFKAITNTFAGTITGKLHSADKISISYLSQIEQSNNLSLKDFAQKHHLNYADFLNILHKLGTERDIFTNSINQMSSGQQKKVYLAKSLLEPANLYLWDEPLNYLDVFNQEQIIQLIKKYHPTMLVIEHDQRFIDELGAQVIHLT